MLAVCFCVAQYSSSTTWYMTDPRMVFLRRTSNISNMLLLLDLVLTLKQEHGFEPKPQLHKAQGLFCAPMEEVYPKVKQKSRTLSFKQGGIYEAWSFISGLSQSLRPYILSVIYTFYFIFNISLYIFHRGLGHIYLPPKYVHFIVTLEDLVKHDQCPSAFYLYKQIIQRRVYYMCTLKPSSLILVLLPSCHFLGASACRAVIVFISKMQIKLTKYKINK